MLVSSQVLPKRFWTADRYNIRGGVEMAFISVTRRRDVALDYAARGGAGNIFEIRMGMVDRGADLKWLSQYRPRTEDANAADSTRPRTELNLA